MVFGTRRRPWQQRRRG